MNNQNATATAKRNQAIDSLQDSAPIWRTFNEEVLHIDVEQRDAFQF